MKGARLPKPHRPTDDQRRAADPKVSVWVAASAGAGKTQVLTDRLLRLLLSGVEPATILCLTYTKAAATEMSVRLLRRLSDWVRLDETGLGDALTLLGEDGRSPSLRKRARQLFATALETPGGLKIQTIHAFAERLLQLFPVEAGLAPGFRVLEEQQSDRLRREALMAALQDEALREDWALLADHGVRGMEKLEKLAEEFLSGGQALITLMASDAGQAAAAEALAQGLALTDRRSAAEIVSEIVSIDAAAYLDWSRRLHAAPEQRDEDEDHIHLRRIGEASAAMRIQAISNYFLTDAGKFGTRFIRKDHLSSAGITDAFEREKQRLSALFNALWLRQTLDATLAAARAMAAVHQHVEAAKRAGGLYDFNDLIARTAQLLSSSLQAQWVLYKLDTGLTHVLVDEAQDTSPSQWQIILALAQEFFSGLGQHEGGPRTVFVVGDRKQSIYSFQGADTRVFDETYKTLKGWAENRFETVGLTISYRSLRHVLKGVDTVFAKGGRARHGYGDGQAEERDHVAERKEAPGVVEIWPLITRDASDEPNYWKAPTDSISEDHPRRKLARLIAETLKSWIGKRQLHGAERAVEPGDILILLQRRNVLFSSLIAELRRLGIPVAGADRLKLREHIIIHDLLALVQVLHLPHDDYSLACLLKSPLMPEPLDDDRLFALAHGRGATSLRQRLQDDSAQAKNASAIAAYEKLAANMGPFGFFSAVTQKNRTAILQRLGSEAEDAIRAFLDLALTHEQESGLSLAGFAAFMSETDFTIKREMEEAEGQVRIMTVHGAKGLEAPIVILPDAADVPMQRSESGLVLAEPGLGIDGWPILVPEDSTHAARIAVWKDYHKQRAFEENMRLLYVGMTRARDELYICGSHNERRPSQDSWWTLIDKAIGETKDLFRSHILPDGRTARRLGPDDVPATKDGEQSDEVAIPEWVTRDTPPGQSTAGKHMARSGTPIDLASARRGIAIHGLLEALPDWAPQERMAKAKARSARHGLEGALIDRLLRLFDNPETAFFFAPGSQAEVNICGTLANGEFVTGRIDRLAWQDGNICILDYKSSARPEGSLPSEHRFVAQLAGYAALLREAHPGAAIKAAVLWTQSGEIEWIPDNFLGGAHSNVQPGQS